MSSYLPRLSLSVIDLITKDFLGLTQLCLPSHYSSFPRHGPWWEQNACQHPPLITPHQVWTNNRVVSYQVPLKPATSSPSTHLWTHRLYWFQEFQSTSCHVSWTGFLFSGNITACLLLFFLKKNKLVKVKLTHFKIHTCKCDFTDFW